MKTLILICSLLSLVSLCGCTAFSPEHQAELQQQQEEMDSHAKAIGENLRSEGQIIGEEAKDKADSAKANVQAHLQPSSDARISDEDVHRIAKEVVKEMGNALDKGE